MDSGTEKQSFLALFKSDHRYHYLDAFITLFVVVLVITNVIAPKFFVFPFLGLSLRVSVAQLLFPITYVFGDIFTEVYGKSASRRAIWYGFFALSLFAILSYMAVAIHPAPEYKDQPAFYTIFHQVGRNVAGSMLAYWCGEFCELLHVSAHEDLHGGKAVVDKNNRINGCRASRRHRYRRVFHLLWPARERSLEPDPLSLCVQGDLGDTHDARDVPDRRLSETFGRCGLLRLWNEFQPFCGERGTCRAQRATGPLVEATNVLASPIRGQPEDA